MIYENLEEIPLYNWFQVQEKNDLIFLLKDQKFHAEKETLANKWRDLNFEFIELFGISEDYRKVLESKRMIDIYRGEMIINDDTSMETMIDIELAKIEAINNKHKGVFKGHEQVASVELGAKFLIDEKKISVKKFYSLFKALANGKG